MVFANGFALCVGVGGNLPVTVDDAKAVAKILRDPERCAYPEAQVRLTTGPEATSNGILAGLDWLQERTQEQGDATVVVYFSGHGSRDHFLVGAGNTLVSPDALAAKLDAIRTQKLLLLLDCCYAAGVWEPEAIKHEPWQKRSGVDDSFIDRLQQGSGRVVLSSSRRNKTSFVGSRRSMFTTALVEALSGEGAADEDGLVRLSDVIQWVAKRVPQLTADKQVPVANFRGADNFAIAYYGAGSPERRGVPDWVGPQEPLCEVLQYPPGPLVPFNWLPFQVIDAYGLLYATPEASTRILVEAANMLTRGGAAAKYLTAADLPDIGRGATAYWTAVFDEATRLGPRMVAALLLAKDDAQLPARAKKERTELLERMKDVEQLERGRSSSSG